MNSKGSLYVVRRLPLDNRVYILGYILNPSTSFPSKSEISLRICLF